MRRRSVKVTLKLWVNTSQLEEICTWMTCLLMICVLWWGVRFAELSVWSLTFLRAQTEAASINAGLFGLVGADIKAVWISVGVCACCSRGEDAAGPGRALINVFKSLERTSRTDLWVWVCSCSTCLCSSAACPCKTQGCCCVGAKMSWVVAMVSECF